MSFRYALRATHNFGMLPGRFGLSHPQGKPPMNQRVTVSPTHDLGFTRIALIGRAPCSKLELETKSRLNRGPGIPNTMTNEKLFLTKSRASGSDIGARFESLFLQHLDAAYNLARLLTRNEHDAEDVVQESYLRALSAFSGFRGGASRPWFLTIVRNTSFTRLRDNRSRADHTEYHEDLHASGGATPEAESLANERARALER